MKKLLILLTTVALAGAATSTFAADADETNERATPHPLLETLDPFYKQHVTADGLLIARSNRRGRFW